MRGEAGKGSHMSVRRGHMIVHEEDPYNAEPTAAVLAEGPTTPIGSFYSRNHGPIPVLDPASWRLSVDGLVDRDLELDLATLRGIGPTSTLAATLQCAGNRRAGLIDVREIPGEDPWHGGAISTAEWTGVRLADVLTRAGVRPGAAHVAFAAPDEARDAEPAQPYGSSIPIEKAMADEVLLAWGMNGEPLPPAHGAPVRAVVPGYIGARSVKWVQRISVQAEPSSSFFQQTAYRFLPPEATAAPGAGIPLGPLALNSEILVPEAGDVLPAGRTTIRGYAMAGEGRTVERVDVSVDGGATWRQAELGDQASVWTWRWWSLDVDLAPGEVEVVARAWDSSAALQPSRAEDVWNPKGYANTSWPRVRLRIGSGDESR